MEINELHWMLEVLQRIDVGVLVIDRECRIELWNGFMESHSGQASDAVRGKSLFGIFPDIDQPWLRQKAEAVISLGIRSFTLWEQRPYLIRFSSYRPITGQEDFMYQNTTFIPIKDATGKVGHVCIVIHDATQAAGFKRQLQGSPGPLRELPGGVH